MGGAGFAGEAHAISALGVFVAVTAFLYVIAAAGTALLKRGTLLARLRPQGEVHISPVGVYRRPGAYAALLNLREVDFVDRTGGTPALLRFTGTWRGQPWQIADIAVPCGREEEARALARRFRLEVIEPV
ncbi:hypothetical protein [Planomonospora venezuelensis]|uniref:Uncharacterized protein n=1 Tax=Planomonospora venezuelensis TaxID=1999 RepID=A0A841D7Z3_PLAVE|nr:hypothetical protein [Planomonospora venezuelensis]MBB5966060.1 hypothetical protein [Planomonospora venezuelensis]GIN03627.1 hypothetical protein Pve01_52850 [Planomonospora venezuelensis]